MREIEINYDISMPLFYYTEFAISYGIKQRKKTRQNRIETV